MKFARSRTMFKSTTKDRPKQEQRHSPISKTFKTIKRRSNIRLNSRLKSIDIAPKRRQLKPRQRQRAPVARPIPCAPHSKEPPQGPETETETETNTGGSKTTAEWGPTWVRRTARWRAKRGRGRGRASFLRPAPATATRGSRRWRGCRPSGRSHSGRASRRWRRGATGSPRRRHPSRCGRRGSGYRSCNRGSPYGSPATHSPPLSRSWTLRRHKII